MALVADDPAHRVEQMLTITARLTALVTEETRRIDAREPPLSGADAEEKNRLANAYRLELARIKQDRRLVEGAPPALLTELRSRTGLLHERLAAHEASLSAVKLITEGLVQAMAEEAVRQRGGAGGYGAHGAMAGAIGPIPAIVDRIA